MGIAELLLLAVGLSMDAFAVSVSNSMCYAGLTRRQAVATSASFGIFQGIMPLTGFFAGLLFAGMIQAVDHWIALILLGFIGGKMLLEAAHSIREPESCPATGVFTSRTMLIQALATSIDALAVGVSLAALEVNIWGAALLIALITFAICIAGSSLGRRFGMLLGDWAQVLGGLILVGIGIKIFVEHMFFGG